MDDMTRTELEAVHGQVEANELADAKAKVEAAIAKSQSDDDPGAIFEPDIIEALRLIREHSRAEYMRFRAKAKRANKDVLITELDREVKGSGEGNGDQTLAESIITLVRESATFFHDAEGLGYVSFEQNGHLENWPLGSKGFNHWCSFHAYTELGVAPSETTLKTVITALSGVAKHEGEQHEVFLRVAKRDDRYYLDLCNEAWQAVEITATGWQVLDNPPVKFRRTDAMQVLPLPVKDGDINLLWPSVNIAEADRPLVKAWLLEAWRSETPFPVIELGGQQGSGKSDTQHRLRDLVDPNQVNLRAAPKTVEDIYVGARNNWLVSFNNLSHLTANQQDAFCTLASGGGFASRTLYTNADETVIECQRPAIFNGIATLATAQDLVDRLIRLDLPEIKKRRRGAELAAEFEKHRPAILGGLLDLFIKTLARLQAVKIDPLPRMADFATLGEAMMQAQDHPAGVFLQRYQAARERAVIQALESSPVAGAVQEFIERNPGGYSGLIKKLFELLEDYRTESEGWPRSSKGFADALRRHAPGLAVLSIKVWFNPQRQKDGYHVQVMKVTPPDEHDPQADPFFSEKFKTQKQSTQYTPSTPNPEEKPAAGVLGVHDVLQNPRLKTAEKKSSPDSANTPPPPDDDYWDALMAAYASGQLDEPTAAPEQPRVRCGDCQHYAPDTVGDGSGIGRCGMGRKPKHPEGPFYPKGLRWCTDWRARP